MDFRPPQLLSFPEEAPTSYSRSRHSIVRGAAKPAPAKAAAVFCTCFRSHAAQATIKIATVGHTQLIMQCTLTEVSAQAGCLYTGIHTATTSTKAVKSPQASAWQPRAKDFVQAIIPVTGTRPDLQGSCKGFAEKKTCSMQGLKEQKTPSLRRQAAAAFTACCSLTTTKLQLQLPTYRSSSCFLPSTFMHNYHSSLSFP